MMQRLRALWKKEWLALWRDRHGLLALFVMPAIFILVMSLALQDAFAPGKPVEMGYAVVDLDRTPASAALIERLRQQTTLRDHGLEASQDSAMQSLQAQRHIFVLLIPQGFGAALQKASDEFKLDQPLRLLAEPALTPGMEAAFRNQILAVLGAERANALVRHYQREFGLQDMPRIRLEAWQQQLETVAVRGGQAEDSTAMPSAVQQSVPAWLIFSMFFVIIPMAAVFITERQHGTLQRLRSQQVPYGLLLAGKLLPFFLVNQIQTLLMLLVGLYLVPLLGGGKLVLPSDPTALLALWLMAASVSLAAVCWALCIASVVRTSEQATVIGGVGNILMGAIGGIMVPRFIMPPSMQTLTHFSPMSWGLEGFHAVLLRHGALAQIAPHAAALLLFALACLLAAVAIHSFSFRVRT